MLLIPGLKDAEYVHRMVSHMWVEQETQAWHAWLASALSQVMMQSVWITV